MASERLIEICQQVPRSVFFYLQFKYESLTLNSMDQVIDSFQSKQGQDKGTKEEHMRLFRPNLENPANKQQTAELDEQERARSAQFKEVSIQWLFLILLDNYQITDPFLLILSS